MASIQSMHSMHTRGSTPHVTPHLSTFMRHHVSTSARSASTSYKPHAHPTLYATDPTRNPRSTLHNPRTPRAPAYRITAGLLTGVHISAVCTPLHALHLLDTTNAISAVNTLGALASLTLLYALNRQFPSQSKTHSSLLKCATG
jgi:hypothetical protein